MLPAAEAAGQAGNCLATDASGVLLVAMPLLALSLAPLKAYPPAFVLACVVIAAGAGLWVFAALLKWTLYTAALATFAVLVGATALWLWG